VRVCMVCSPHDYSLAEQSLGVMRVLCLPPPLRETALLYIGVEQAAYLLDQVGSKCVSLNLPESLSVPAGHV
jgi:hypothetical protein